MSICENAIMQYSRDCMNWWMITKHPFIFSGIVIAAVFIYAAIIVMARRQ